jgi:hypothetical protein
MRIILRNQRRALHLREYLGFLSQPEHISRTARDARQQQLPTSDSKAQARPIRSCGDGDFFVRVRRSSHGKQRDKCKHHQCKSARRLHHILLKFLSEKANSGSSGNYLWCKFYGEYSWSVQQADHRNMLHYRTTVKVLNVIRIAIITGLSVLLAL